jgi:hypothetical protein
VASDDGVPVVETLEELVSGAWQVLESFRGKDEP